MKARMIRGLVNLMIPILLAFSSTFLMAQNKRFQINGQVLDRETQAALTGVNISMEGTRGGCSTNQFGEFYMISYTLPVYINLSYVGYESQKIYLDNTSNSIVVQLKRASRILQEVEIKAKNDPVPFFKDNKYSVLDYEVDSNLVYLLIYRFRVSRSELLYKSIDGDTIARSGIFPFKPTMLFIDCMHNLHVLTDDSAYQVIRCKGILTLGYPTEIKRFRSTLIDCVISTDSSLFFRKESPDQLSVEFFQVDRQTRKKKVFSSVSDEQKLMMLRQNPGDYHLLIQNKPPRTYEAAVAWLWVKKILYKTNTSSMHKIDNQICVFNTADYTLGFYTLSGDFTSKLKMPVEKFSNGRWTTDIYIDDIEHKAYTSFRTGGMITLCRIDLNTGELKRPFSIVHNFPHKIKVYNNILFYLYDIPGEGDNKHLFKQKL